MKSGLLRVRARKNKKGWQPTREEYQRMALKHDTLLKFAKQHADDPTGILSALYHDIVDKYCNVRAELRLQRMQNAELRRMVAILKNVIDERNAGQVNNCDKW